MIQRSLLVIALVKALGPVAAMIVGIIGGTSLTGAAAWAWNLFVDNPAVERRAADSCTIRVMDAANRGEQAERQRQAAVREATISAYETALATEEAARRMVEAQRNIERADYERKLREAGRSDVITDDDFDWLRRERGSPARSR